MAAARRQLGLDPPAAPAPDPADRPDVGFLGVVDPESRVVPRRPSAVVVDCEDCEAEALTRVLYSTDLLHQVLWRETAPLRGVEAAIGTLQVAAENLRATGYEP